MFTQVMNLAMNAAMLRRGPVEAAPTASRRRRSARRARRLAAAAPEGGAGPGAFQIYAAVFNRAVRGR